MTKADFIHHAFIAMLNRYQGYPPDADFIARRVNDCIVVLERSGVTWDNGSFYDYLNPAPVPTSHPDVSEVLGQEKTR